VALPDVCSRETQSVTDLFMVRDTTSGPRTVREMNIVSKDCCLVWIDLSRQVMTN
jgi:hypothetical protein